METIDLKGLSLSEVRKKMDRGQTNDFTTNTSTSTWQIIKRNVFTLFNTLNFVIAVALAAVQAWSNMIFFRSHLLQCHYRDHDRDARQADD